MQVIKLDENESTSIKVAQLVQWGGAPAALARDSEPRGHAKRVQPRVLHTVSHALHLPPPPIPHRALLFPPSFSLACCGLFPFLRPSRCTHFTHMQRPLSDVSLAVMLSGPGKITVRLRYWPVFALNVAVRSIFSLSPCQSWLIFIAQYS